MFKNSYLSQAHSIAALSFNASDSNKGTVVILRSTEASPHRQLLKRQKTFHNTQQQQDVHSPTQDAKKHRQELQQHISKLAKQLNFGDEKENVNGKAKSNFVAPSNVKHVAETAKPELAPELPIKTQLKSVTPLKPLECERAPPNLITLPPPDVPRSNSSRITPATIAPLINLPAKTPGSGSLSPTFFTKKRMRMNEELYKYAQHNSWRSLFDWQLFHKHQKVVVCTRPSEKKVPGIVPIKRTTPANTDCRIIIGERKDEDVASYEIIPDEPFEVPVVCNHILDLPDELLLLVFSYVDDAESLIDCMMVCQSWANVASDSSLWKPIYTSLKVYCDASMLSDAVLQQEYLKCWRMAYIELKRNIYQRQIKEPGSAIKQFTTKRSHSFGDLSSYVVANASILAPALSAPSLSSSSSSITLNEDESVNGATSKKKQGKKKNGSGGEKAKKRKTEEVDDLSEINRVKRAYFKKFEDVSLDEE